MRATALRIPLSELEDAEFVKVAEQYVPSYAVTKSKLKASRVSVFGIVVRRYEGENFTSIKLDDFTGVADVIAFENNQGLLKNIKEGNAVKVIGRVRQGNNGLFIALEGIQKLNFKGEMFKRLEIIKDFTSRLKKIQKEQKEDKGKGSKEKAKKNAGEKRMLDEFIHADEIVVEREVVK